MRTSYKYFYIYLFFIAFFIVAFTLGFLYFKEDVVGDSINIIDSLNTNNSTIINDSKNSLYIFISSIFIVPLPLALFKLFYFVFSIGFIFHFLINYNFLFGFLYILFYYLIPLLFLIVLFRVGISIAKNVLLFILRKNKVLYLNLYVKKYVLIFLMLVLYDLLFFVFSGLLNSFLGRFIG